MRKRHKLLWRPRYILLAVSLIYAGFLILLGIDVFSTEPITLAQISAFVIHSIPGLLVALSAMIGLHRPLWGAFGYAGITIAFWLFFHTGRDIIAILVVHGFPITLTFLYGLRWVRSRKSREDTDA